jgi:hypothetical protein
LPTEFARPVPAEKCLNCLLTVCVKLSKFSTVGKGLRWVEVSGIFFSRVIVGPEYSQCRGPALTERHSPLESRALLALPRGVGAGVAPAEGARESVSSGLHSGSGRAGPHREKSAPGCHSCGRACARAARLSDAVGLARRAASEDSGCSRGSPQIHSGAVATAEIFEGESGRLRWSVLEAKSPGVRRSQAS